MPGGSPSTVDLVASIPTRQQQRAKPGSRPAPAIGSPRQRAEKRLRFRDLGNSGVGDAVVLRGDLLDRERH
jgi:hypothetical protein